MEKIIKKTKDFAKNKMAGKASGQDWQHVYRVYKNATKIAEKETANSFIVQLASLLHGIADWKVYNGDIKEGLKIIKNFLNEMDVDSDTINHVIDIVQKISFKGAQTRKELLSKEGQIVQDADRLDALGAMGIARTFAYGGYTGREIYNPEIKPILHKTFEDYKKNNNPSINHFYEKLLLLKDLMNTNTAKEIALQRHAFMEQFLNEFHKEADL